VPRSVIEAIAAQESNWWQATFHALPGVAADPLVADYYGNGGNSVDQFDTGSPDCGYGITQVTDNMRKGQLDPALQAKIAVDYEENIAAGLRILEQKWNRLYADGIVANDGSPSVPGELVLRAVGVQHRVAAQRGVRKHHWVRAKSELHGPRGHLGTGLAQQP